MSARQMQSHAAILRGIGVLFVFCELASLAGVMPSLLRGGLVPLFALPFFAPSLLGAFASQLLLRPRRDELAVTAAAAAVLALPLWSAASALPLAIVNTLCAALGAGAIVSMTVAHARRRDDEVLEALLPALILPGFVSLAHPMVYLTAVLWPTTFDHRMYLADAAFGAPLSFSVGRLTAAVPALPAVCLVVYVCLPLALMLVHAMRQRAGVRSNDALVAFVAVTVVGYVGYHVVPVTGPVYVFGAAFPLHPPDPSSLHAAREVALPMPRNCMPSLHSAWALLVWWNARPLSRGARASATAFLAITLLATVGLGFHYAVDLVAAFPLTLAAQAWATNVSDPALRRRAMAFGAVTTAAWMAFVTWSDTMLVLAAPLLWMLAAAVIGVSSWLERRVYEVRSDEIPDALAPASPVFFADRAAVLAAFVLGVAAWMHETILFNALAPTLGATPEMRAGVTIVIVAGFGLGVLVASRLEQGIASRIAALASIGLLAWTWVAPALAPDAIGTPGDAAAWGFALAAALAAPGALASGLAAPSLSLRGPWLTAVLAGAAAGALLCAYAVLPSPRSNLLPVALTALAAFVAIVLAARPPEAGRDDASPVTHPGLRALVAGLLAGTVLTAEVHLVLAMLGDTAYARAQAAALACGGLAAGPLLARRFPRGGDRRIYVVLAAFLAVTIPAWAWVPAYFASFRGYIDQYQVMGEFSQHEFIRLCCAALFLLPSAVCSGALISPRRAAESAATRAGLGFLGAVTGAMLAATLLIPQAGSAVAISACAFAAVVIAFASFDLLSELVSLSDDVLAVVAMIVVFFAWQIDVPAVVSDSALTFRPSTAGKVVLLNETIGSVATVHGPLDPGGGELRVGGLARSRSDSSDPGAISGVALTKSSDRALVIGLGNGEAAAALHAHGFNEVVVTEASNAGIRVLYSSPMRATKMTEGGFALQHADGRAFLRSELEEWDLVLVDQPELSGPEAGAYFTTEFYALVAARLAEGGVLREELALERLSPVALASILASARKSFGEVQITAVENAATLIACAKDCRLAAAATAREASDSSSTRIWVDSEDMDALIASVAETIHVPAVSLASGDDDMFLRFQAPVSFRAAPEDVPDSRRLLGSFAYRP